MFSAANRVCSTVIKAAKPALTVSKLQGTATKSLPALYTSRKFKDILLILFKWAVALGRLAGGD